MTRKVSVGMRLKAWWHGYEVKPKPQPKAGRGGWTKPQPPPADHAEERDSLRWNTLRTDLAQALWGQGMISPGGPDFIKEMVNPVGLTNEMSLIDIGAGLGGSGRLINETYGTWVTGLEEDDALAKEGATLSDIADMGQRASVKQVDLSEVRLKPHAYDAAFSKEALYCVRDKNHLLNQLAQALKPEGQLVFTDYVVHQDPQSDRLNDWLSSEPVKPIPWSLADYEQGLTSRNIQLHVKEDVTSRFVQMVRDAWARHLEQIHKTPPDKDQAKVIQSEAELWSKRTQALESGLLRIYRFHGVSNGV